MKDLCPNEYVWDLYFGVGKLFYALFTLIYKKIDPVVRMDYALKNLKNLLCIAYFIWNKILDRLFRRLNSVVQKKSGKEGIFPGKFHEERVGSSVFIK